MIFSYCDFCTQLLLYQDPKFTNRMGNSVFTKEQKKKKEKKNVVENT